MGLPVIGSTRPWSRWHVTALVAAALGYAWVGGGLRPFSWPAMVSTTLGGLAILIPAWRRGRSPASVRASHVGLVAWTLWLIAATGWELWALSMHPRSTHPTISSLLDTVGETHPDGGSSCCCGCGSAGTSSSAEQAHRPQRGSGHGDLGAEPRAWGCPAVSPLRYGAARRRRGEPDPAQPRPARVRCCRR